MNRRAFIRSAVCAAAWPNVARAQTGARTFRIGLIFPNAPVSEMLAPDNRYVGVFANALRALGYVEGANLVLDRRSAEGNYERYSEIGLDLIRNGVDVIVAANNRGIELLKGLTKSVPIVMVGVLDPIGAGLVASLARPEGNVTGFTFDPGGDFEGARLQLLTEAAGPRRIVFFGTLKEWKDLEAPLQGASRRLGVNLVHVDLDPARYLQSFPAIIGTAGQAVLASRNGAHAVNGGSIADFLLEHKLPGMFYWRGIAESGGLMSYGADFREILRRAAGYVDRILKGARPAELPVQQPTTFELVINARTAKALDLKLPPTLLTSADEIIE